MSPILGIIASSNFPIAPLDVQALIIAGAGGSGGGGNGVGAFGAGSGAGGYRTNTFSPLNKATNYTVTIGAGGAGGALQTAGSKGNVSTFSTYNTSGGGLWRGRSKFSDVGRKWRIGRGIGWLFFGATIGSRWNRK